MLRLMRWTACKPTKFHFSQVSAKQTCETFLNLRARSRRLVTHLALGACAVALPGCLAMFAATDPYDINLAEVQPGTDRSKVIAVYGQSKSESYKDGKEVDIYECDPAGPKRGERTGLVVGVLVIDAASLGFLEFGAATLGPINLAIKGRETY